MLSRINQFVSVLILAATIGVTAHAVDAGGWNGEPIEWAGSARSL